MTSQEERSLEIFKFIVRSSLGPVSIDCEDAKNIIRIIADQAEDIERLKDDNEYLERRRWKELSEVRAEAIKEFAERFIKKVHDHHYLLSDRINSKEHGMFTVGIEQAVNETKKEMVGGK